MLVQAVIGSNGPRRSALGGDGMTTHGVHLGDNRDVELRIGFSNGDRGPEPRAAAAYQHHVMRRGHVLVSSPPVLLAFPERGRPS